MAATTSISSSHGPSGSIAVLIERCAGTFPVWLAPIQARVIAVEDREKTYVGEVANLLRQRGFRVDIHTGGENPARRFARLSGKLPVRPVVGRGVRWPAVADVRSRHFERLRWHRECSHHPP